MAKKKRREGPVYTVVALGDSHDAPDIPKDRFRWIGRWAAEVQPTHIVSIGDFLTADSLNTHVPNETFAGRLKRTYMEDISSATEALKILDWELTGLKCRKHLTMGNHERRAYLFQDKAPEVAGMLSHEMERLFESNGWTWTEYGEPHKIGGVAFTHICLNRLGKSYGGMTAENQIANHAIEDQVIGHSHVARVVTAPKVGGDFVRVINLGSTLPYGHIEPYARHTASGWSWCCWSLTIFDGHIQSWTCLDMRTLEKKFS